MSFERDEIFDLVRCLYSAIDRDDRSTLEAVVPIAGIHIDRFQGDMLVTHRGQLDMHRLYQQLQA